MKLSKVCMAMMASTPFVAGAAALDRSGQSVGAFFEDGNYAELSYVFTKPNLPGKETLLSPTGTVLGTASSAGDTAQKYSTTGAAIKFEPQKNVRVAAIYDQPMGVDYAYQTGVLFKGSAAKVKAQALTTLVGSTLAPNFWVYGGLAFEDHQADVTLAGAAFQSFGSGYNIKFEDAGVGYVGGVAYEIPDIALRAAVTYRSKVEHETASTESNLPTPGGLVSNVPGRIEYDSPQSVNLDFQTGINQTTLLMADVRWVNWKDFKIGSPNASAIQLTNYETDQISAGIGIGKKLTNNFSGLARVSYDTGTGSKDMSIFGPYQEEMTFVLGGKYNFNKNVAGSLAVAYTMLGDGEVKAPGTDVTVAKYDDNNALSIGGKIGYHF